MTCICTKLFGGIVFSHIAIAAIAQHFLGWLWYHGIFESIYMYYFAADKGVKRAEHAKVRFSETLCLLSTLFAGVGRSLATYVLVKNLNLTSACEYQEAGLMIAAVVLLAQHQNFWAQRPLPLILVNASYEVACALLGAFILYSLVGVNLSLGGITFP